MSEARFLDKRKEKLEKVSPNGNSIEFFRSDSHPFENRAGRWFTVDHHNSDGTAAIRGSGGWKPYMFIHIIHIHDEEALEHL
jgi:hypothetical protein